MGAAQSAPMIDTRHAPAPRNATTSSRDPQGRGHDADDAQPDPAVVRIHPWPGVVNEALGPAHVQGMGIGPGRTATRGVGAGVQAALRELTIQAASQGTQALVRALLISQAHRAGAAGWTSPLAAAGVVVMGGVGLGGRAVETLVRGQLAPDTRLARGLLTALPVAIDLAGVTATAWRTGIGGGVRLLAGIAARLAGCVAGGIVAQVQDRAWGTLRLVSPRGERIPATRVAHDIDPLRVTMAACMYALGCMCFLVFLVQHLTAQDGGHPDSQDFGELLHAARPRAVSVAALEVVHAFIEALVQVAVVLRAGLAFEYVPGQPGRVRDNLLDWRGTWDRVRDYAGVRVWLGSVASDLPSALGAAFATDAAARLRAGHAGARMQALMSLRGWILQQPGEVAAQGREARWQPLERAVGDVSWQLVEPSRESPAPDVIRIRVIPLHEQGPQAPAFDVVYGGLDDRLEFLPAQPVAPG